ncbi:MAG: penicillin-binding protein activator LpoB, partial [Gemmatimonadales bacterium]|nr:penicillin-binding protein activator LpoB [Gemmatimonadales bacterium]
MRQLTTRGLWTSVLALSVLLVACSKATRVDRIEPDQTVDISGDWNDTDSRLVADEMIRDATAAPWARRFMEANAGKRPAVVVGRVTNKSSEHINVNTFVRDMVAAFIRTETARIVSSGDEREQLRFERYDQQDFASAETRARLRNELGADFMLLGEINTIFDREGGREVKYYQV